MNRFCSMFSQLLKLFPRTEFQALVARTLRFEPGTIVILDRGA